MFQFYYLGTTDYFYIGCFITYHSKTVLSISLCLYISEIYVFDSFICYIRVIFLLWHLKLCLLASKSQNSSCANRIVTHTALISALFSSPFCFISSVRLDISFSTFFSLLDCLWISLHLLLLCDISFKLLPWFCTACLLDLLPNFLS